MDSAYDRLTPEQRAKLDEIAYWHQRRLGDIEQRYYDDKNELEEDLRQKLKLAGLEEWSGSLTTYILVVSQ